MPDNEKSSYQYENKSSRELRERLKELNCMYGFSQVIEKAGQNLDEILGSLPELIAAGWQYPEITAVRVSYGDKVFTTANFKQTDWLLSADITTDFGKKGRIEVYYLKEMPLCDEGPFLKEERKILDMLAAQTARVASRIKSAELLKEANQQLRAANQQLQAGEQQLRAANQQLRANESELESAKLVFQEMFEKSFNCIAIYEPVKGGKDFVLRDLNPAAERTEKLKREEVAGKRWTEIFPGIQDRDCSSPLYKVFKTGASEYVPPHLHTCQADIRFIETGQPENQPPFKSDNESVKSWRESYIFKLSTGEIVVSYIDVTAQIESKEKLKAVNQQLRAVNQQLRAGEQQLRAANQQLRAANQQLRSNESELRAGRQIFEEMFEKSFNCIAIYEPTEDGKDFIFRNFNPSAQRTENIKREDVVGKRMTKVFPGVAKTRFFEASLKVSQTGAPEYLLPFKYDDGRVSGWRESYIFKLSSGEMVTTYLDVTSRIESKQKLKAANQQLRAANQQLVASKKDLEVSKQLFEELFRCTTNCIAIYEAVEDGNDFILKNINPAAQRTEKVEGEDVTGRKVLDVFPGLKNLQFVDTLKRVYKTGIAEDVPPFKHKGPRLSGWSWRKNYVFKLPSGEVVASYSDITEKVNNERMLLESEERFRHAYERSPLGYQSLDKDGCILKVNPAWSELTGYSFSKVRGKSFADFVAPDCREYFKKCFDAFKKDGELYDKIFEIVRKDGSRLLISVDGKIGHDHEGNFKQTHCILKDMTAQKQKEKQQEELNQELEERVKQRTSQLDRANAKLHKLAFRFSMLEEETKKKIAEQIHDDTLQILVYMNIKFADLLNMKNPEQNTKTVKRLEKETRELIHRLRYMLFDLKTPMLTELGLAASIQEWLRKEVEEKYGISTKFEDEVKGSILDQELSLILYRSVRELLANVVKHADAKNVRVVRKKLDDYVVIEVEDDGKGFKQSSSSENDVSIGGFGLLSIEERLHQHKGELEIESPPEGGTRVILRVPHR
jgi:PAS domain S-box-containing protein